MRYIIYGAGGIGSIMGGHLMRARREAVLIGRRGHVEAIRARGLRLITPTASYIVPIPAYTDPAEVDFRPDDVVCLSMKGQDTEEAVKHLKRYVEDVPVVCFQNGVRNEETVSQYFPRTYGAMVRVGAVYLDDGEVIARRDPPGWYIIGRYPAQADPFAEEMAQDLRAAGYFVRTVEDVMPYKWGKLMTNLGNAIGAISNGSWAETDFIYKAVAAEAEAVVKKAGIKVISQQEVADSWPEITAPLKGELKTQAQSSTWQSLARHQGHVETEFLNGEIVRQAKKAGMEAPLNEKLVGIALQMAREGWTPGHYSPAKLGELLGIEKP